MNELKKKLQDFFLILREAKIEIKHTKMYGVQQNNFTGINLHQKIPVSMR